MDVSSDFFRVLGVVPALGRAFASDDARLGDRVYSVVGVMPNGFKLSDDADLCVPAELDARNESRTSHNFLAIGRLLRVGRRAGLLRSRPACGPGRSDGHPAAGLSLEGPMGEPPGINSLVQGAPRRIHHVEGADFKVTIVAPVGPPPPRRPRGPARDELGSGAIVETGVGS